MMLSADVTRSCFAIRLFIMILRYARRYAAATPLFSRQLPIPCRSLMLPPPLPASDDDVDFRH